MRRAVPLLACLLALATGLALLGIATTLTGPTGPVAPLATTDGDVALAYRFYAAVDIVMQSGDATALDQLVAPDVAEHPPRVGVAPGRDGLVRALQVDRATFPGLRLVVDDAWGADDRVTVLVHVVGATTGTFLGLAPSGDERVWGPLEVLRFAGGRVAERWGSWGDPTLLEPLGSVPLPTIGLAQSPRQVSLEQLTYASGAATVTANEAVARLFVVEAGTLTTDVDDRPGEVPTMARARSVGVDTPKPAEVGRPVPLAAGDLFLAPPSARYALANHSAAPAVVLVVTICPIGITPADVNDAGAPGIATRMLTAGLSALAPPGATLAVGRATVAGGANLSLGPGRGAGLFIIDAGTVDLRTVGGQALTRRADGQTGIGAEARLSAGDGVALAAGTAATVRAGGTGTPATLLLLTIAPNEVNAVTPVAGMPAT